MRDYPVRTGRGWYVAKMSRLEWLETVFKLSAIACGLSAFTMSFAPAALALPTGPRLAQVIILGIISLGLLGAIMERLDQREIGAMVFVLLNNLGHWGMLLAVLSNPGSSVLIIPFSALMLAGDGTKLAFFASTDFTVRNAPKASLLTVIAFFAAGYAAILILELIA